MYSVCLPLMRVLIVLASVLMMAALYLFIQKTGSAPPFARRRSIRARRLMGIDVNRVRSCWVFLLGPALGGAAGLMVGL